ncbi:hypothetical protein M3J09_008190 [Ascochyta lentis]
MERVRAVSCKFTRKTRRGFGHG